MIDERYSGRTAVMFATGPSLTEEIVEQIRPYHESGKVVAFGCNDSYRRVDYLDVLYVCDGTWWKMHLDDVRDKCKAEKWTQEKSVAVKNEDINYIYGISAKGFSLEPNRIHFGSNSGYQQLNLAYLMGIRKFILVGYNMGVNGSHHFFGFHPKGLNRSSPYATFIQAYNSIQPSIKKMIVNCTEPTALTAFRTADIETVLESL